MLSCLECYKSHVLYEASSVNNCPAHTYNSTTISQYQSTNRTYCFEWVIFYHWLYVYQTVILVKQILETKCPQYLEVYSNLTFSISYLILYLRDFIILYSSSRQLGPQLCKFYNLIHNFDHLSSFLFCSCDVHCKTCFGPSDNNCLSCEDGYMVSSSHLCILNQTCPIGQFRALDVGDCELCHDTCYSCSGPSVLECTSCKNGQVLVYLCAYLPVVIGPQ